MSSKKKDIQGGLAHFQHIKLIYDLVNFSHPFMSYKGGYRGTGTLVVRPFLCVSSLKNLSKLLKHHISEPFNNLAFFAI